MDAVMAFWNPLAAMLCRPCDSLPKVLYAGPKARKTCSLRVDNKFPQGREGEKGLLKNKRMMRECL
jgi:hypothetical protein